MTLNAQKTFNFLTFSLGKVLFFAFLMSLSALLGDSELKSEKHTNNGKLSQVERQKKILRNAEGEDEVKVRFRSRKTSTTIHPEKLFDAVESCYRFSISSSLASP
jgi:hypothetical protein